MAREKSDGNRPLPVEAVEEPSWTIPALVLGIVAILSLGFLGYYFAPNIGDLLSRSPAPSEEAVEVDIIIGTVRHRIPANYTRFAYVRRGGILDRVELYALWPDLDPYSPDRAAAFQDNSADSQVIYFELEAYRSQMAEADRFRKVFQRLVADPKGERGPHGLRRYAFAPDTPYRDQELFVREQSDGELVVLRCFRDAPDIFSPSCRRDMRLSKNVMLSYRFKRALLGEWRDIDERIQTLARSFVVSGKAN